MPKVTCSPHAASRDNARKAAVSAHWELLDREGLRDPETCRQLRTLIEECGDPQVFHDPAWLARAGEKSASRTSAVYVARLNGELVGYAPFTYGSRQLRFTIGELTFFRPELRSFMMLGAIVIAAAPEPRLALLRELFQTIAERLRPDEGVFLDGVPTGSAMFRSVAEAAAGRRLLMLRLGGEFEHQFIKLPVSFQDYEAQIGSHARKHLRYAHKRLAKDVSGDLRVARFTDIDRVPDFVTDAQKISERTYQWRLLGFGLRDAEGLSGELAFAAQNGWLRSYILYCRGEPAAFMLGYRYRHAYHYIDVGYDPAWAKWSVGSILQMEVLKDLLAGPNPPQIFDFSIGFGDHKARFGNTSRPEINLLLMKSSPRNALLATAYTAIAAIDRLVGKWAAVLGIKARIKRWLRRSA